MRVNDGFELSTAATKIALNNRRLVENSENFGGQNWFGVRRRRRLRFLVCANFARSFLEFKQAVEKGNYDLAK